MESNMHACFEIAAFCYPYFLILWSLTIQKAREIHDNDRKQKLD